MSITLDGTNGITTPDVTSSGALNVNASAPDNSLVVDASGNLSSVGSYTVGSNDNSAVIRSGGGNTHLTLTSIGAQGAVILGTQNGTERARIDASGHLIVPAGVTLGTSAGTYNAANTLDDYEEGTWTPSLNLDGTTTYSRYSNKYIKIGNQVTVYFAFYATNGTSQPSTVLAITGLPFTVAAIGSSGSYENGAVALLTERMSGAYSTSAAHNWYIGAQGGTTQLNLFEGHYNGSIANHTYFSSAIKPSFQLNANVYMVGQLTYTAA